MNLNLEGNTQFNLMALDTFIADMANTLIIHGLLKMVIYYVLIVKLNINLYTYYL